MFQYRKRYGLHAILRGRHLPKFRTAVSIPQAVWIACNGKGVRNDTGQVIVSIPQAVWIACNTVARTTFGAPSGVFQYRKRYGLHAIW